MEQRTSVAQDELIAFLLDPESYPHHPKRVCLVQTHASYVFLGFPYVYKVKKKVNFGFLDFSSQENRRYYSEREVILNRRLCPEIYLGVIPMILVRRVISRRHTVGFKRVWMRGVSEEHIRCDT